MDTASIVFLVLGVIFGVLGAIFLIVGIRSRNKAKASLQWPVAQGVVLSSTVIEHQDYDEDDHRTSISYEPVVQYRYSVGGQDFSGNKLAFGANRFDSGRAQGMANQYPAGATVNVHYNPNNPGEAVIETKAAGGTLFLIIGIVFLVIGLAGCCAGAAVLLANVK